MSRPQERREVDEEATLGKELIAPAPDDPAKPQWPWQLSPRAWRYALRRAWAESWAGQVPDAAGNLAFMAVLSMFPALLAILALLSFVGEGDNAARWILHLVFRSAPQPVMEVLWDPLQRLAATANSGIVLVASLPLAVWSASAYVSAFGRASNRIYGVVEGRPLWLVIPRNLLITALMLIFGGLVVLTALLSVGALDSATAYTGTDLDGLVGWRENRWTILVPAALVAIVSLYTGTPNVRMPKTRWQLIGALFALVVTVAGISGFTAWVSAFGFATAYGAIGSFVVLLLALWLLNLGLLWGVVLNAEVERARELQAGFRAEHDILLPPRGTRMIQASLRRQLKQALDGLALKRTQ